jgi:hypothetical protein
MQIPNDAQSAQARVNTAAGEANRLGLISATDLAAVTDGTVSHFDLKQAEKIVKDRWTTMSPEQQGAAEEYKKAITDKLGKQSSFATAWEDLVDLKNR